MKTRVPIPHIPLFHNKMVVGGLYVGSDSELILVLGNEYNPHVSLATHITILKMGRVARWRTVT